MKQPTSAGGFPAIWYTLRKARASGSAWRMLQALRSRNACKTCALGMGGQHGGMVNEAGRFPEVCKKSVQAMAADMQGRVRPDFFDEFDFDHLERLSPRELEGAGRLVDPLYAGPGDRSYRPITWDDALDRIAAKMRAITPDDAFFYFSGRSSNEAGFLLQLVARLYGTNNVNNCSFFCHQASGVGLASVTGSGTATIALEDIDKCDLIFLIGGNPASNHPRLMRSLMDLKRRRGKVIVVNPLREIGLVNFRVPSDVRSLLFGTPIADEYLQPHIGGDIALLTGVARALLAAGAIDERFIADHTEGWEAFRQQIEGAAWPQIERASGVARADIERAAALYAASKAAIFCWTMGITHHVHGVDNVRMIANLALMRGMLGAPGRGLLPLRGHSNVQGMGSIGAAPQLKDAVLRALEERFGAALPRTPGMDTLACVRAAAEGRVRFALSLGGNLYGSCPDSRAAREALRGVDLTAFLSTTLNTGHIHGRGAESIILPVLARDEEPQPTTQESMFNYVRLSDGGFHRLDGPRSEVEVIADIAERALGPKAPLDFASMRQHKRIREAIAAVVPGYEAIGAIDTTRREFHIAGRTFHQPSFATPTGRARFHPTPIPIFDGDADAAHGGAPGSAPGARDGRLRLMTIRSEGQFNTVVYEEEDIYRGQERRDVILMNEHDMARLGITRNDRVLVSSELAEMEVLARPFNIPPGNAAMYYPEANAIVPAAIDESSRTPSFKNVAVTVRKARRLAVL
jgi:molybdopterin-dependent oxidoreductase alpha subunit